MIDTVQPSALIHSTAKLLKEDPHFKPPVWANFVKTGAGKERAPVQKDWWYMRAASLLRKVYILGPVGTQKLRTAYGSRKNNGHAPEHFVRGSGSIIRTIFQQAEKSGLVKQAQKGTHKGRVITPQGMKLLAKAAKSVKE